MEKEEEWGGREDREDSGRTKGREEEEEDLEEEFCVCKRERRSIRKTS
jgi:hypothetical protein